MLTARVLRPPARQSVFVLLLAFALSGLSVCPAYASGITPEEEAWLAGVQAEIEENGYDWVAGHTSVSGLSPVERAKRLGGVIPPHIQAIYDTLRPDPEDLLRTFPESWDWREMGGTTPAKDQGSCGSCWAFGAIGATEANVKIAESIQLDLSEQQPVDCNFQGSGCGGGWSGHAYELHMDPGAVDEECMPYLGEEGSCRHYNCEKVAFIDGFHYVSNNISSLKSAVTEGPLSVGMTAYDDFSGYTSGCYEHAGNDPVNHVVLLVGWDDNECSGQGAWICKNSWGTAWGIAGFFYIKFGTCNIGSGALVPENAHVPKERLVPDEYGTIQAAIDASERGDIIKVAAGTYEENVVLTEKRSLIGGYDATFSVRDPALYPTIIDCGGSGSGVSCDGVSDVVIDGFVVSNSGASLHGIYVKNGEVAVRDCDVSGCWRGITVTYGAGSAPDGDAVIEDCVISGNTGAGIFINSAPNPAVHVRGNAVFGNEGSGIVSILSASAIVNNTVVLNHGDAGVKVQADGSETVKNNIIVSNTGYGLSCAAGSPSITYNDVWDNTGGDYSGCSGGTGSISEDPIFCDVGSFDMTLHAASPCIGAGEGGENMGALEIGCPEGPTDLEVVQEGASLALSWSPPSGIEVDYYIVYRDTIPDTADSLAGVSAPETTFVDITIPPCMAHNYRVSAVDTSGLEGAPSDGASGELCYPAPSGLAVTFDEGGNELTWSGAGGPVDYYVVNRRTATSPMDSVAYVAAPETAYVDTGTLACPRDSYTYAIGPVYDTGWRGSFSNEDGVDPAPEPPSGLSAEWVADDIVLTWLSNCESDFRRYWIYRDTIPISPPVNSELLIGFTPDTTFVDEQPDPGPTYFYRLTATDASSQRSSYSETAYVGHGQKLLVPGQYTTIQEAIDAAAALDTVLVSPDTYEENVTLKDGVVVMSSDGRFTTIITSGVGSVVSGAAIGELALLEGFTVDGQGTASYGLDCMGSYLMIRDCAFQNASSGAAFSYGGKPDVDGCLFTGNTSGVACFDDAEPFLRGNTIEGNSFCGVNNAGDPGPEVGRTLEDANDFADNGYVMVFNQSAVEVNADYNYWGDVCVQPEWFHGPIDYIPWTDETHTSTYTQCPIGVDGHGVPSEPSAALSFPNPFNPSTTIRYDVPSPGARVRLAIYNAAGREVRRLVDESKAPGTYIVRWFGKDDRGRGLSSGVYFYRLAIGDYQVERKMVMLK